MPSTGSTTPESSLLPLEPFDGMIFIDAYGIKWVYNEDKKCWLSDEKIDRIPLASPTATGLLSKDLKAFLDTIPVKGGGFAIMIKPVPLQKVQGLSPLQGEIVLESESLDIQCITPNGDQAVCSRSVLIENIDNPPGIDFSIKSKLLDNFCIEIPGGEGPRGPTGDTGDPGLDGVGDGPKGDPGDPGNDATTRSTLSGVKIIESDDIYDTAIVDAKLNNGDLLLKRGKIATISEVPVKKVIAKRLLRDIQFGDCFNYTLVSVPCATGNAAEAELANPDPTVVFLPKHFDPNNLTEAADVNYQACRGKLSDVVNQIVNFYQTKLQETATQYDNTISKFLQDKDSEARSKLDELLNDLFDRESADAPDFCMGINGNCNSSTAQLDYTPYDSLKDDPTVQSLVGGEVKQIDLIVSSEVTSDIAPILSYEPIEEFGLPGLLAGGSPNTQNCGMPLIETGDNGCWTQLKNGVLTFQGFGGSIPAGSITYSGPFSKITPEIRTNTIPDPTNPVQQRLIAYLQSLIPPDLAEITRVQNGYPSSRIIADLYQQWSNKLAVNLRNCKIVYKQNKVKYSPSTFEFPADVYMFVYEGGAFTQLRLSQGELHGLDPQSELLLNGIFQKYWVGNEYSPSGDSFGKNVYIQNPYDNTIIHPFKSEVCSLDVGLQVGWAPSTYQDGLPSSYFTSDTNYNISYMSGSGQFNVGLKNMDPQNKDYNPGIEWIGFPTLGASIDDPFVLEEQYKSLPWGGRMIAVKTSAPGFFYTRIKSAVSFTNVFSSFIMPPLDNFSYNRALVYDLDRLNPLTLNARPIAVGSVKINVVRAIKS